MKNKKTIILVIFITGLFLAFFVFQANYVSAKNRTLKDILFPQSRQAAVVLPQAGKATLQDEPAVTLLPEGMVNPPAQESVWVTNSPEQLAKNAAVVESVSKLIDKTTSIYATAGWVHTASKTEGFSSLSDTMPDGSPIPMMWSTDVWLLLDEKGYVVSGITIQDTGSPSTSQVSIFKDGIWNNLTLGTTTDTGNPEDNKPYRPADQILEQALTWKDVVKLEAEYTVIGEERVMEYSMTSRSLKPYEIGGDGYMVMGNVLKYYLSMETGLVMMIEQYDITPEDQLKLIQRITTIVDEKVEQPPAEVMKYLE